MNPHEFKDYFYIRSYELGYEDLESMNAIVVEGTDCAGWFKFVMIPYVDGIELLLALKGITRELYPVCMYRDTKITSISTIDKEFYDWWTGQFA